MFSEANDADLASKTKKAIGDLSPCQASAVHTVIEGGASQTAVIGNTLNITVKAKDHNGRHLTTGGDILFAQCTCQHAEDTALSATVTDNQRRVLHSFHRFTVGRLLQSRSFCQRREDAHWP